MKKITLNELASLAGVSTSSIVRFFKHEQIAQEDAKKIESVINESKVNLDEFEPLNDESNHSTSKVKIHAFLCNDITKPKTRALYDAIVAQAHARNELCIACDVNHDPLKEELYLKNMSKIASDCIVASCISDSMVQNVCHDTRCRYFALQEDELRSCGIDDASVGELIGQRLIEQKHLVIRYLGYDETQASIHYESIKEAYHARKQPLDFDMKICKPTFIDAYEKLKQLLSKKIDLLILADDFMCLALQKYLMEYKVFVPQNFDLITIGNYDCASMCTKNQSVLSFDYQEFAKDLLARISGEEISGNEYLYWAKEV